MGDEILLKQLQPFELSYYQEKCNTPERKASYLKWLSKTRYADKEIDMGASKSWLPELKMKPSRRDSEYGVLGTKDKPLTVEKFTRSGMWCADYTAWDKRGSTLDDLITLAEEYGQYFAWHDGTVYPRGPLNFKEAPMPLKTEHQGAAESNPLLLLLCKKRSQPQLKRSNT